ncbi:MAG: hypothetical protein J0I07_37145, partial [Myxococcales bacterium]|nr:hypothetical protein [Myxococcales bacterium]
GPSRSDRIAERLAAAGVMSATQKRAVGKASLVGLSLGALVLLAAGGAVLFTRSAAVSPAPAKSLSVTAPVQALESAEPQQAELVQPPSIVPSTTSAGASHAPASEVPGPARTVSVDELPTVAATNSAARRTAEPPSNAGLSELQIVQRAQASLSSDPARALELARTHERTFPAGAFVQEREVIAVDALARLHRREEATTRARALLRHHPATPYAARLEAALGTPLISTSNSEGNSGAP